MKKTVNRAAVIFLAITMHLKNPALLRGVLLSFVCYLMTLTLMMPSMSRAFLSSASSTVPSISRSVTA